VKISATLVAFGALLGAVGLAWPVAAASYTPRYAGMTQSSVTNCPAIAWRIGQSPDGALHGMMWYYDMSGMSAVSGKENGGHFHLTLKSVMGNGPVGTVEGQIGKGATLTGDGCANATFKPVVLNTYGGTG
jgi:hypothetical protein